jgi:hypothetical protein
MEMWIASAAVNDLLAKVRIKHSHLEEHNVSIIVLFSDGKPFVNDRINLGSLKRTPKLARVLGGGTQSYEFCLIVNMDVWTEILNPTQQEALLDLHLSRIEPEYEPETITENKKKKVVKDELGRVKYTSVVKTNEDGRPKWKLNPLDLQVFTQNVTRYGLWSEELATFSKAVEKAP